MAITDIRLYQYSPKASPVPSDIIYLGDSEDSFNECKSTIAEIISAYPALALLGASLTLPNDVILGTPASGDLSNCTNLPAATGISGLGSGVADALAQDALGIGHIPLESDFTFTPILNFGGLTTGITYGVQKGVYSTVGNILFFNISIVLTSKGSATGVATITGLTEDARNIADAIQIVNFAANNLTYSSSPLIGYVNPGESTINLQFDVSGTGATNLDDTAFTNTTAIYMNGFLLI